jgi:Immunity protein 74
MSTFSIPRVNVIESTNGFSVEVQGRTGILYSEGGKVMRIDSEVLAGPAGMMLYTDSMNGWDPPYSEVEVSVAEKSRIVENIKAAFLFRGFQIQVN